MIDVVYSTHMKTHLTGNTFLVLFVVFVVTFLVWYAKFHWSRRKMYEIARKVHGPRGYPLLGSALEFVGNPTTIFNNILNILEKYSPVAKVWFGHRLFYTISKPEHLEIILNSPYCLEKENLYKYARTVIGTGLLTAPVKKWKKNRKLISPTFNSKILDSFVCVFAEQSTILVDELKKYTGKTSFDAFSVIASFSLNTVCETALGVKVNAQTRNSQYGKWVDKVMMVVFLRMFVIWYHFDFIFNRTRLAKTFYDVLDKMHKFTRKVIVEKRQMFENRLERLKLEPEVITEDERKPRKAFLDLLLELSYEGEKLTDDELRQEVDTITIAGSDTTASTIGFILIMLGLHQDVQNKVFDEIIDMLGYDRDVTAEDLPKLKYLERVIKETLRLFPVGPFVVRAIEADIHLDNYVLPAGSSVVLGYIHTHRSSLYWKDPLKFNPDRFVSNEISKRHPYSYLPFSGGPRNCVGARYAIMAMKTVVATVVRKYQIRTTYKSIEDIVLKTNIVLRPVNGFNISLEERE